jgi:hypothetical protein
MTPEQAASFYVDDEDPAPLFAAYDVARAAYEARTCDVAREPMMVAPAGQAQEAGNLAPPVFGAGLYAELRKGLLPEVTTAATNLPRALQA